MSDLSENFVSFKACKKVYKKLEGRVLVLKGPSSIILSSTGIQLIINLYHEITGLNLIMQQSGNCCEKHRNIIYTNKAHLHHKKIWEIEND